jgi:diguanylate cyclase (GGDEF)-like protein
MMFRKVSYGFLGALLGLGAPLGAFILRYFLSDVPLGWGWIVSEWTQASFFYLYMTVGTVSALALFGYSLGRSYDSLSKENESIQSTTQHLNLLAITDGLTHLYNHRYLHERLEEEVLYAQKAKAPLTCLMLDIDNFKHLNDRWGHPYGDSVLAAIARILRENTRKTDVCGRYGGEEFLVILSNTPLAIGQQTAERIRTAVETFPFREKGERIPITLSVGVASLPAEGPALTKDQFIAQADEALYLAKASGKNRVSIQHSPPDRKQNQ